MFAALMFVLGALVGAAIAGIWLLKKELQKIQSQLKGILEAFNKNRKDSFP